VQSTGATGGPRSPGAPSASAGSDQFIPFGSSAALQGSVTTTGTAPTVQWKVYSGPGTVTFGDATQPATTASFSQPGSYLLMLSAADGVHAVAYDAVTINVTLAVNGSANGQDFVVQFPTQSGRTYQVVASPDLTSASWTTAVSNIAGTGGTIQVPIIGALSNVKQFYRVEVLP